MDLQSFKEQWLPGFIFPSYVAALVGLMWAVLALPMFLKGEIGPVPPVLAIALAYTGYLGVKYLPGSRLPWKESIR